MELVLLDEPDEPDVYAALAGLDAIIQTAEQAGFWVAFWEAVRGVITSTDAWPEEMQPPVDTERDLTQFLDTMRVTRALPPEAKARGVCVLDLWLVRTRLEWGLA